MVIQVDLDLGPRLEPQRAAAFVGAEAEQPLRREDAAGAGLAPGDPFQLAQLLERVDANVRVRADAERNPAMLDPRRREEAVGEIGLGRRTGADCRAALREQVELGTVGMRRVHDGDVRPEAAGALEELDRPAAVLGEALLDLPRLLVDMDVQREAFGRREAPDLLEPFARTGADGVGGEADADAVGAQRLELAQVLGRRLLAHPRQPAAGVRREQEDDLELRLAGGLHRRARLVQTEVVELADGGVAGRTHLPIGLDVEGAHRSPASAARPPPASARARPRSRRRRPGHAARAGRCGCGR